MSFCEQLPVALSETEASELVSEHRLLIDALELEEIYNALIDDFIEFESDVLDAALTYSVRPHQVIDNFDRMRRLFNRRLMHLLTMARSYLHCAPRLLRSILKSEQDATTLVSLSSKQQYDAILGYRVMEGLRNSAQHWGFPIHGIATQSRRVKPDPSRPEMFEFNAFPNVSIDDLEADKQFKRIVLNELRSKSGLGQSFDIRPFARDYIEGLSNIHDVIRKSASANILNADRTVCQNLSRYKELNPNTSCAGIAVVRVMTDETFENIEYISDRPTLRRLSLQNENPRIRHASRSFVTGHARHGD